MNCEACRAAVGDYVDGALGETDRNAVEAHLASCGGCRAMADDFAAIRRAARTLERQAPRPEAWMRVAAAIDAERTRTPFVRLLRRGPLPRRPLAIAATLLVIVGGTSWMLWRQASVAAPATQQAVSSPAAPANEKVAQTVENELKLAEEHYQRAIAGLEQITRTESATLDPQVASVLQKNLAVIDQAIGESRAALQAQPTSQVAQESLFEALRNKVGLLQDTIALINEMRKGNQEGAARVASGLNQ